MSLLAVSDPLTAPTWTAAIATVILAAGAIVTAIYAGLAFTKQAKELRTLESQAQDQQELTRQQGELLGVQAAQLGLQREQFADQRAVSEKQTAVLELQAQELRESLDERKREREQQHRAQAEQVYVTLEKSPGHRGSRPDEDFIMIERAPEITATVHNYSHQIIRDVQLQWHKGSEPHGEPNPEPLGELIPGADQERERQFPADAYLEQCGAVVVFRDAAGTRWLRRPDGDLQEQP